MNLTVTRNTFTELSTIGDLAVNGEHYGFTLEPPRRADKPCCIPLGTYDVKVRWSAKHGRLLPGIENVPGFEDIEIHPGNFPKDTLACLLVGKTKGPLPDFIGGSALAFDPLYWQICDAAAAEEAITISYLEAA